MAPVSKFADIYKVKFPSHWDRIASFRKPIIAAVDGYAVCIGFDIAISTFLLTTKCLVNLTFSS